MHKKFSDSKRLLFISKKHGTYCHPMLRILYIIPARFHNYSFINWQVETIWQTFAHTYIYDNALVSFSRVHKNENKGDFRLATNSFKLEVIKRFNIPNYDGIF